jgi:hypothetical protein
LANIETAAENAGSDVILLKKGKKNLIAVTSVGSKELDKHNLVEGYNKFKFSSMTTGKVKLEVWDGSTMIGGGYGKLEMRTNLLRYNER